MKSKQKRFKRKSPDPPYANRKNLHVGEQGEVSAVKNGLRYVMVKIKDVYLYHAKFEGFGLPKEGDLVKVIKWQFGVMVVELIQNSGSQIPIQ